jgi:hypothetical protein
MKEVLFSGGGSLVCYQLGIAEMLYQNYSVELCKEDYYFGGSSAGAITAGFLTASLQGFSTPKKWYKRTVRKYFKRNQSKTLGGLFTTSNVVWEMGATFYDSCKLPDKALLNDRYHAVVTTLPWLRKKVVSSFNNRADFGDCIKSTTLLPLLNPLPFTRCGNNLSLDGVFNLNVPTRSNDSELIFFDSLNVHKVPQNKQYTRFDLSEWRIFPITHMWVWGNTDWADKLFNWGYSDAMVHKNSLDKLFCNEEHLALAK